MKRRTFVGLLLCLPAAKAAWRMLKPERKIKSRTITMTSYDELEDEFFGREYLGTFRGVPICGKLQMPTQGPILTMTKSSNDGPVMDWIQMRGSHV